MSMLFIPFIAGSGEFPEESINCIIPSLSCGVYQGRMKCQTLWLLIYPLQILFLVLYSWSNGIYIIGRNYFGPEKWLLGLTAAAGPLIHRRPHHPARPQSFRASAAWPVSSRKVVCQYP